jgi:hypothetical protein
MADRQLHGHRRPWADRLTLESREPLAELLAVGLARGDRAHPSGVARPPETFEASEQAIEDLRVPSLVAILGGQEGIRIDQHQPRDPSRMGRCQQHGDQAAIATADHHGLGRPHGVQDRLGIIHPSLEGRQILQRRWVRQPDPAHVENDETQEAGQSLEEMRDQRVIPLTIEVVPTTKG